MSRFSRQAQRIETDWLRGLRAVAKDRLAPQTVSESADSPALRVKAVLETRRRRRRRTGVAKQPPPE